MAAPLGRPVAPSRVSMRLDSGVAKFLDRWFRMGVNLSSSSRRGRARAASWIFRLSAFYFFFLGGGSASSNKFRVLIRKFDRESFFPLNAKRQNKTYLKTLFQPPIKSRQHHTQLFLHGHIRLPAPQKHPPRLHQFRHSFKIHLKPPSFIQNIPPPQPRRGRHQFPHQRPPLLLRHRFPIHLQRLDKRLSFPLIIRLKAEFEKCGFDTCETTAEVFG